MKIATNTHNNVEKQTT